MLLNAMWKRKQQIRDDQECQNWRKVQVAQSCLTLCDPMDYTVRGILQARILEWVAFPFSRVSSQPRDRTQVSCIAGRFFTSWATKIRTPPKVCIKSLVKKVRNLNSVELAYGGLGNSGPFLQALSLSSSVVSVTKVMSRGSSTLTSHLWALLWYFIIM